MNSKLFLILFCIHVSVTDDHQPSQPSDQPSLQPSDEPSQLIPDDPQTSQILNQQQFKSGLYNNVPSVCPILQPYIYDELVIPQEIRLGGDEFVHMNMIFTNITLTQLDKNCLVTHLRRFVSSLFSESLGTPFHLIFNTDLQSKAVISQVLCEEVGKVISSKLLYSGLNDTSVAGKNWKFPRFQIEYVDINYYFEEYRNEIDAMKPHLCYNEMTTISYDTEEGPIDSHFQPCAEKFKMDLFYLSPLYPAVYTRSIQRLVILDIDLDFRCDIGELYKEFDKMNESQMIASAKEWSIFYWYKGYTYRKENPNGKRVGEEGILQGLNSGITLIDLGKVWKDEEVNMQEIFNPYNVGRMAEHFKFTGDYGDQEFYVLLSWYYTDKFYMLPCNFNAQVNFILWQSLDKEIKVREDVIKGLTEAVDDTPEEVFVDENGDEWDDIGNVSDLIEQGLNRTAYSTCEGSFKILHFNGNAGSAKRRNRIKELDAEIIKLKDELKK